MLNPPAGRVPAVYVPGFGPSYHRGPLGLNDKQTLFHYISRHYSLHLRLPEVMALGVSEAMAAMLEVRGS